MYLLPGSGMLTHFFISFLNKQKLSVLLTLNLSIFIYGFTLVKESLAFFKVKFSLTKGNFKMAMLVQDGNTPALSLNPEELLPIPLSDIGLSCPCFSS